MASIKKRKGVYYAQYYVGTKQVRKSLRTQSVQVAKAKLRQIEQKLAEGEDNPLPFNTPVEQVLEAYARHVRAHKRPKNAQNCEVCSARSAIPCVTHAGST